MNREIKYKGKKVDSGEWVYGYYVKLPHPLTAFLKDYIVISGFDDKRESGYQDFILVKPETVGQFTGLLDKNGKEIYEGDIVKSTSKMVKLDGSPTKEEDAINTYEIFYHQNYCEWFRRLLTTNKHYKIGHEEKLYYTSMHFYEVIGNIHD